jgi:hypothetical protein
MRSFLKQILKPRNFQGSKKYWEDRYAGGGLSGRGSYGELAQYKADVLNRFVIEQQVASVIEFGCGDGNQLGLASYPKYTGLDVSATAIRTCIQAYGSDPSKSFFLYDSFAFQDNGHLFSSDLALSLDVTYHLVEDEVFHHYMKHLFAASKRLVAIYAWDVNGADKGHVRHRKFSDWVKANEPSWEILRVNSDIPKPAEACDFFFYRKIH